MRAYLACFAALYAILLSGSAQAQITGTGTYWSVRVSNRTSLEAGSLLVPVSPSDQEMVVVDSVSAVPGRGSREVLALCIDLHRHTPGHGAAFRPQGQAPSDVLAWIDLHRTALQTAFSRYRSTGRGEDWDAALSSDLWSARVRAFKEGYFGRQPQPPDVGVLALGPGTQAAPSRPVRGRRSSLALRPPARRLVAGPSGIVEVGLDDRGVALPQPEERLAAILGERSLLLASSEETLSTFVEAARQRGVFVAMEGEADQARANLEWLRTTHAVAARTRLWVHSSMAARSSAIGSALGLTPHVAATAAEVTLADTDAVVFVYADGSVPLSTIVASPELRGKVVVLLACQDEVGSMTHAEATQLVRRGGLRGLAVMHDALDEGHIGPGVDFLRTALGDSTPDTTPRAWFDVLRELSRNLDMALFAHRVRRALGWRAA